MTTQEMITELARSLGNRTDIDNDRYVTWLNWSAQEIGGMWKKGIISPLRFHVLEAYVLFSTFIVSDDVVSATSSTVVLAAGDEQANDYYNDWVIELTAYDESGAGQDTPAGLLNQRRVIYDYTQSTNTLTLSDEWDTTPDAYTTYSLYKRRYSISTDLGINPVSSLMSFQFMEKQADGNKVEYKEWRDLIGVDFTSVGEPSSFAHRGNEVIFDPTPNSAIKYRIYYYKYPTTFSSSNLSAECDFPIDWHEIIVLGAVYRGFEKLMEPDRATEVNKQFVSSAIRQSAASIEDAEISRGLGIRRE